MVVVQDASGSPLFLVPTGAEPIPIPIQGITHWFSNAQTITINRIDDDSQLVGADTTDFIYRNSGRINPFILRLSFSLKKLDRGHFGRTGERIYLDDDMIRLGAGIGFGKLRFRNPVHQQEVSDELRQYRLQQTSFASTKMFGTVSYNFYSQGDFRVLADVMAGVWKLKANTPNVDNSIITYDPFIDVGLMFQNNFQNISKVMSAQV